VERIEQARVQTQPARYRLTLRHPDGRQKAGALRRFGPTHQRRATS
jgi:hypothetical protein